MKSKILSLSILSMFIVVMLAISVSAVTLAEWPLTTDGVATATSVDSDVTAGTFTSSGVTFSAFGVDGANAEDWELTSSRDDAKFFEVTISPKTGNTLTISDISFDYSASIVGPASFDLLHSKQSNFASPTTLVTKTDVSSTPSTSSNTSLDIEISSGETLTLRWFGYDFTADTNEFRVEDLKILGTVTNSFCENGAIDSDNLKLKVDINNRGEGKDEEWIPLDLIEIEVELENNKEEDGDGDLNDVIFELGLFKEGSSSNIIDEMMWISKDDEEFEVGDIDDDGEDKKHLFEFRVDPREVDDSDYLLKVKAYPDGDESETCIDSSDDLADDSFGSSSEFFADIQITKENDNDKMVVIDEKSYPLVTDAFCSEQVSLSVDVYNVGDKDFDDQIKVVLFNSELGIDEEVIANGNFDEGDKTDMTFLFKVPADAQARTYTLEMETFYDYDKDDDTYDEISEDTFESLLKVEGNCVSTAQATVSATLESGGNAGEELVVRSTITNTGDETASYSINAAAFSGWASSANVNPRTFTLNSGESREVTVTLNVKSDASEEGVFNLEVLSEDELVLIQSVSVPISGQTGYLTGGVIDGIFDSNKSYLWLLGLLNVILVVVIIIVAVRVLRR